MSDRDMNLDDLAVFVQVVDSGGFSAAGRALGRTTKQVSRQVRRLEDHLELALLHRTTRAVSLTDAGTRFYPHVLRILEDVQAAHEDLRGPTSPLRGRLRVAVPSLTTVAGLAGWLKVLHNRHPELAFDVRIADRPVDVVAEGIDIQISPAPPSQTSVVLKRLVTLGVPLAAHPDYLAIHGTPTQPSDLEHHDCLRFVSDQPQHTWDLMDTHGNEVTVAVRGSIVSSSSEVLYTAMQAGIGIGVCGASILRQPENELMQVLPGWTFTPMPLFAVFPRANRKSRLIEAFLDVVMEGFEAWI
ncbi:MAG: LysR family transcriptional regulator [Myxococcota bacterium]